MKKYAFLFALILCFPMWMDAETKDERAAMHHELRLGWGDQLFETLVWHEPLSFTTSLNEDYRADYNENYRYFQHLWLEYQYRHNYWFGYGAMVDFSGVNWQVITRNGKGEEVSCEPKRHNFYNLVAMPTIRFTYLHHPYVNMYSGLGAGICINGGTDESFMGHKTEIGAAVNFTILGLSANYKRFFAGVEYGGLYALKNKDMVFLLKSRMMNAFVGVRF